LKSFVKARAQKVTIPLILRQSRLFTLRLLMQFSVGYMFISPFSTKYLKRMV